MGRRWGKFAVATLALAAALLTAAPAMGADDEPRSNGYGAFALKGSNGYRLLVLAVFQPGYGESSQILLATFRKGRRAVYAAPGVVTDTKIEADFGPVGEIDVAFRPSGKVGVAHPRCAPRRRAPYKKGVYVGTIEFRGEEGYTRVSADRARFFHAFASIGCPYSVTAEAFGRDLPGVRLRARAKLEQGRLALQANQNRPGKRVRVEATIGEKRGRVSVLREVTSTYPASSLDFAPDLRTALLDPPAPFSGAGFFRRNAKPAGRWTGDLAVDFPGRSDVPLTGDRFQVSLRHARHFKETRSPQ